ncbi:phosphotransferase [Ectobacillus funiculus]|uniref:phosphotransferase n=1 Tax=Ectobacillus funiculus TaxID=137993 RepID=UPI00397E88D0
MKQEQAYIDEILVRFFPKGSWRTWEGGTGANNTTRFVEVQDERYVLRIYETHQDEDKVRYEHSVLLALKELPLLFGIPEPIMTPEGDTVVRTKDGKIAGLFRFLDGVNPTLDDPAQLRSFGWTTGQLTRFLAKVGVNQAPVYRPYYEIENTHPRCSLQEVIRFCMNPPAEFTAQAAELLYISKQLTVFQESIPMLKQLPHQLVHGDLNGSNILVNEAGEVSAVLDFEFVTNDLRVMELAVCLADCIRPGQDEAIIWTKIDAFLSGYGSVMKLTEAEIAMIPILIQLRRLDVFLHFLGRHWDGIDPVETVQKYVYEAVRRADWLDVNQDKLILMCMDDMLDKQ